MAIEIPFKRALRLGSYGNDVRAVKRGLAHAGRKLGKDMGTLKDSINPLYGPFTVIRMRRFQKTIPVMPTGKYGEPTHMHLQQHFDRYARLLYTKPEPVPPPPAQGLQLPEHFTPTHQTAGLDGYPAVDLFMKAGTLVLAPCKGTIRHLSGHDPDGGPSGGVHGPYGRSLYLDTGSAEFYGTHFGTISVAVGAKVLPGQVLGTIGDYARWGGWDHIHWGRHDK